MATFGRKLPVCGVKLFNCPRILGNLNKIKYSSITGYNSADKALQAVTGGRIDKWLRAYERTVGLTEVREAQGKVINVSTALNYIAGSKLSVCYVRTVIILWTFLIY